MATTWIKSVHRTNSGSISAAIKRTLEYSINKSKTQGGELVAAFGCEAMTAESEFLLSKKLYEQRTGRNQGRHDVIGYQVRQSFKKGEVTADEALRLGYELAMRWTRGRHQFVVAAHTNTDNPHTHIFFNSVTLDHSRKFVDFKRSAIALRRVSDKLCVEQGLSIVEKPGLSKGHNRAEYLGVRKQPTGRDKLREIIDNSISAGMTFPDLLAALRNAGCEIKVGKQPSIKPPGSKKFFRLDTLGEDYSDATIRERLAGTRVVVKRNITESDTDRKTAAYAASPYAPSLLIDIEQKLREGKGAGYKHWATGYNLQQMSKTLLFIKEKGLDSYEGLCKKTSAISADFYKRNMRRKDIEKRMREIRDLQENIATYGKTRDVYAKYKASGWDRGFYDIHAADIIRHKAAKKFFNENNYRGKLPSINQLKQEWATLAAEKKKVGANYKERRDEMIEYLTVRENAERILYGTQTPPRKAQSRDAR